ncbi:hypothetical protein PRNP1_003619 [Phytophthora ramorum]
MADADDGDAAYALRTPAVRRRDTITRQLQREIMGEMAADRAENEADEAHTTPEASTDEGKSARRDQEQEGKTEDDAPPLSMPPSEERRHTLSPSKAALVQDAGALDAAISRRDTVDPEALKALKAAEQEQHSPYRNRESIEQVEMQHHVEKRRKERSPTGRKKGKDGVNDSPSRFKRPRSVTKKPSLADERRKSSSMSNTTDSFTDLMFAPNLLEQDAVRRPTLDPTEAAAVVASLQMEVRNLNGSALEIDVDSEDDNPQSEERSKSPTKQPTSQKIPIPTKETNKSSAKSRKSPSPAKELLSKKSPKQSMGNKSPTPTEGGPNRRATVDPSDVLQIFEDRSQQENGRRQTIDNNGLLELINPPKSLSAGDKDSAHKRRDEASRKRTNDSDARAGSLGKRARSSVGNNNDETMESMEIDSPPQADAKSSSRSPSPKDRRKTGRSDELPPSRIYKPSLLSPPPGGPRIRTPLKGILSARKKRMNTGGVIQTTPNKSVNFGPSQGAEFNHGSPPTSMTPMCARDASRLYPLDPPEEEPEDAETSLNSSILSEADSLDEEETKENAQPVVFLPKKSGFDLLQQRSSSLLAPKSTDKTRRRQSLRGYSPLDSQTEARRRRRQTINVTHQKSALAPKSFAEKPAANSQSPSRNNSFLQATNMLETNQMPYADSSASSDAGEDMEITGDYAVLLARESEQHPGSSALTNLPREEDTAEFSLGHLLAESAVYELTKSAPESDLHDLPGTLGDLANEVADAPSSQDSQAADSFRRVNNQDTTLDPIQEVDETSSRGQSMMSIDSDDSDGDDAVTRKSISVNLSSDFERVSTGGELNQRSQPPQTPDALSIQLITMEELLSSVTLAEDSASVEIDETFFAETADSSANQVSRNVKVACAYDTCLEVVGRHAGDITSWSTGLTEELSTLLHLKAPAVFSPENLDDGGREAIRELYATEAMVARSGWYQLQAEMEKQLSNSLSLGANALANDVKTLKRSVSTDVLKRQNELAAIKEMIDREEQMGLLLDAIEEQQGAHDEYVTAVKDLEKKCSSLSLEDSVLRSRLKVLEGRAAELEPVTSAAASRFKQEVLATEEMLAIQESMSVWKIREATSTQLRLSARFEDVLFDVEISVEVHLGSPSTGDASTSIKTNEYLKQGKRNTYFPIEGDAVLVLQRLLLDPHYIARIADDSELGDGNGGRVCSKVQVLESFITRSFRFLKELRKLSTHFAMRFNEDDSTLWVDFLKFPSTASRVEAEGAQFSVGFSLLPVFPYTDYQTAVQVPHGQISTEDVAKEIELVPRQATKYFTRVCRRLHESFVRGQLSVS